MKCFLLSFFFLFGIVLGQAQSLQLDTVFLDPNQSPLPSKNGASYFILTRPGSAPGTEGVKEVFYLSGARKAEYPYSSMQKEALHGQVREWHENGQPQSISYFEQGERVGPNAVWYESGQLKWSFAEPIGSEGHHQDRTYFPDGQLKRRDVYLGSKLVSGECFTSAGQDTAYYAFEIMPDFLGGDHHLMRYLSSNIKYPKAARKQKAQGLVVVQYTVTAEGDIENIVLKKGLSPELDEEALRVVRAMPRWIPATQDGNRVPVLFTLPIRYTIR